MDTTPTLSPIQKKFFQDVKSFFFSNPFGDSSIKALKGLLGPEFGQVANIERIKDIEENRERLCEKIERQLKEVDSLVRSRGAPLRGEDYELYEPAVYCIQFHRNRSEFKGLIHDSPKALRKAHAFQSGVWGDSFEDHLNPGGIDHQPSYPIAHLIALFYQLHRAEAFITQNILGRTESAAALRIRVWQSIFTRDLERYFKALHRTAHTFPTLIIGPVGSYKERVAESIAFSQYIPFDAHSGRFEVSLSNVFHRVDLAATQDESFEQTILGGQRGGSSPAFRTSDSSRNYRSLFLDHLHHAPQSLQARITYLINNGLLRIEDSSEVHSFPGKLVAASKQGIEALVLEGQFSEDLFLALSADRIESLSLAQILSEDPNELDFYVAQIAAELTDSTEVQAIISDEATRWIKRNVSPAYTWPGNFRELEQCVRNITIHGDFTLNTTLEHSSPPPATDPLPEFIHSMLSGSLPYDELLHNYFKIVVEREGGYAQASRAIGVDQRTVKKYYTIQKS